MEREGGRQRGGEELAGKLEMHQKILSLGEVDCANCWN